MKASARASPSRPIPLANSLSRCSRKCWQIKNKADFRASICVDSSLQPDADSRPCWFCRPAPASRSSKAPRSGSPGYTEEKFPFSSSSFFFFTPVPGCLRAYTNWERAKLTAMMLKKSSSPSVSKMEETVCLAMVSLRPFMLPLTSTKITTSLGDVAAWMYLRAKGIKGAHRPG